MAGALHVNVGNAAIKQGTRVGQFLLFEAESLNQYAGSYGSGSTHDAKYAGSTH
jgi:deoxycytidine triphosphate deaminase